MTLEFHHKYKWDKILDMCREHNYKGSERCGLHVHINKTAFQRTTSIASLAGWVAKHRRAVSRYAGRHYEAQSVRHYARYTTEDGSTLASRVFNSGDRYQAVNSVNPKTVELRMFASTVDYGVLMARLEMAHAMASYTRDASVVKIMKDTWDDFMRFVEDRPREYPRLPSYMAEMDLPIEQDEDEEYF
jgi:hypothetical protein